MVGSELGVNSMNAWFHPALYKRFRLVMVLLLRRFSWHTLGRLVPIEHGLNASTYLAENVHV